MLAVSYNNNVLMMTLYLLRNAFTTSEVSIKKIQSNLTYDVAIESSTNIATVGGKQKRVKQFRLLVTSSF
jgi:hypothetical protein